jgi:transposase
MNGSLFWFNDEQWARIEPHLPTNQRGPEHTMIGLILSGITGDTLQTCTARSEPDEA